MMRAQLAALRSFVLLVCWIGIVRATTLLTIGASPMEMTVAPKEYQRFEIDLVNDYCSKTDIQARQLCMNTPYVKVHVVGCQGESWLLTNPTQSGEPTVSSYEYMSANGNGTNFVESSEFSVVQSTTHIAVYNPGYNHPSKTSTFQIWAENSLDYYGYIPGVTPIMRPGDQWFQVK